MRISDWSSDVCSSDLEAEALVAEARQRFDAQLQERSQALERLQQETAALSAQLQRTETALHDEQVTHAATAQALAGRVTEVAQLGERVAGLTTRSEEHTSELQSLMRSTYAVL